MPESYQTLFVPTRLTREYSYTAIYEPLEWGYVVFFPAIPGISTFGETLEEARERAGEVLRAHLEELAKEGLPLPDGGGGEREVLKERVSVTL